MAITTLPSLPSEERYSNKNNRGGTEPQRKLKKLRSVKVANLDKLRLSMRREWREKMRFNPSSPSESSSSAMSGTSSPNYMKATTSSSARKAKSSSSNSKFTERMHSPASRGKSSLRLSDVVVEQCSDSEGVNIPVDIKSGRSLKRVPSMKKSAKLSSMKSLKIRAKYSQFPDKSINAPGDQDDMVRDEPRQNGWLERSLSRSRSIRLMRLKSVRSSRKPKSRFGGGATAQTSESANAEHRYMKATSSQEARKGLARTSSLKPLRIPSLRPRRSKVRKRPAVAPLPGISVDRATCSSVLKSSKLPDHIELNPGGLESEGIPSLHVCPYSYCSLHGLHNHATTPPLKEFISARRQFVINQKGKQLENQSKKAVTHSENVAETNELEQTIDPESPIVKEVINARTNDEPEGDDTEMDYLIKIYAKPRKKWAIEGFPRDEAEAVNGSDSTQFKDHEWKLEDTIHVTSAPRKKWAIIGTPRENADASNGSECTQFRDEWKLEDTVPVTSTQRKKWAIARSPREDLEALAGSDNTQSSDHEWKIKDTIIETSILKETEEALYEGMQGFGVCNLVLDDKTQQQATNIAVADSSAKIPYCVPKSTSIDKGRQTFAGDTQSSEKDFYRTSSADPEATSGGDLINVLSDKQKYSSIWHLIYQQFISSEESMGDNQGVKSLNDDVDIKVSAVEKVDFDQTAAVKLVQEALDAILRGDIQPSDERAIPDQENPPGEKVPMPPASSEENFSGGEAVNEKPSVESKDEMHNVKEVGEAVQQKVDSDAEKMPRGNISKSFSKLRKAIVTAKFIKAMEKLRKINPGIPRHLSSESASEEGRTYLRHLSVKEGKDEEEWMLDFALRKAISRLSSDEQRRVAILVEAFETFTPDNDEKSIKCSPVKQVTASGNTLITPTYEEARVSVPSKQEVLAFDGQVGNKQDNKDSPCQGIAEGSSFREDHGYKASTKDDKILQEAGEAAILSQSTKSSTSIDREFKEPVIGNQRSSETVQSLSQYPAEDSEVSTIFLDQQKYTSMWSMIYQHIVSSEANMEANKDQDDDDSASQDNDLDSTKSSYSADLEEHEDNRSARQEKLNLDQSAAIKVVREAVNAILQHYEVSSDQQSITDQNKATDDVRGLHVTAPTHSTEESSREGNNGGVACSEPEPSERTSDASLQQVEAHESKLPEKKMSKSLSKLKKAIVMTNFIKAVERLRKISPQKPRHLFSEADSKEEQVYLRHLSMNGRRNSEEWMLDHALRQVIYKLAPEQQRRVALLVEAFETVTPEQKEKKIGHHPLKDEHTMGIRLATTTSKELKQFKQERSVFEGKVPQKQENEILSSAGIPEQRSLQGKHDDHQVSTEDDSVHLDTDENTISQSTLKRSVPEVDTAGDMTRILSDKQKYTSIWQLIYQHAVSSDPSTAGEKRDDEVDEREQEENSSKRQDMNQMGEENHQGAACRENELDQSAAIKLVKEAINAILQSHEQKSDEQSLHKYNIAADSRGDCSNKAISASTEEKTVEWKIAEKDRNSKPENELDTVLEEDLPIQKKAETNEVKTSQKNSPKSLSRLKKVFITAKFMKAMERMRRISPRKPQHLFTEAASEKERVYLRHQDINERRNTEQWMLDYALRKVISDLAPEQRRRVASLVEAFEIVTPEQKGDGIRGHMKAEGSPNIEVGSCSNCKPTTESDCDNSTSYDDHIHPNLPSRPGKAAQLKESQEAECLTEISNFKTKLHEEVPNSDGNTLQIHHQTTPKDGAMGESLSTLRERKEIASKSKSELLQGACSSTNPKQSQGITITKSIFSDTQKQSSMWHLIYQHAKSVIDIEAESNPSETAASKVQFNSGSALAESTSDADADDSDASSVTSELTESDAIKLVKEAINDILAAPQELDNELLSSNIAVAAEEDQRTWEREIPEKTLSRGHSKLRKLIICNKFIKAMEKAKMRKSYPQRLRSWISKSAPEAEKANLKPCAVGEKKNPDELMLDRALQKVIAGLAPVQQRRVALLVEAFEKVNPDLEETEKRFNCSRSDSAECLSAAGNATSELSDSSNQLPGGFNLDQQSSVATPKKEVATKSSPQEMHKEKRSIMCKEDWSQTSPSSILAAMCDVDIALTEDCEDATEINYRELPGWRGEHAKKISVDASCSEPARQIAEDPSQPEDFQDQGNTCTKDDMSLGKVRHTSLWRLLVQHVNSDVLEGTETQKPDETDANASAHNACGLHELDTNDHHQLSSDVNPDKDMNFQMPKSKSFELQEKEAIKVVQEALDAILTCDDQSTATSTTSDEDSCPEDHDNEGKEPLPATKEIGVETIADTIAKPKEEQTSGKEKSSNSYSQLSKVVLCNRFIKAMDKMRKLKLQNPQAHSDQTQSDDKIGHPMRQTVSNQRKNWEEWMLDHAMQQVVGKLAPVQKKKVSLLVQAFEAVSSPEVGASQKGKAAGL